MKSTIRERIKHLRAAMKQEGLDAWLINGSDPHMSEYVPERWQTRAYISDFTGSYGWLAITLEDAALWTDSRYYLQASEQLQGTGITMMKAREPESITTEEWLGKVLDKDAVVGFDAKCYAVSEIKTLKQGVGIYGYQLKAVADLLDQVWTDRPAMPQSEVFLHPQEWAGKSCVDKIDEIKEALVKSGADLLVISALDDLCWTFNIRGADVDCNPVVMGFALIGMKQPKLFIDVNKLNKETSKALLADGIELIDYEKFYAHLTGVSNQTILLDPTRTNAKILDLLFENNDMKEQLSIPALMKSRKNPVELEGMKKAHVTDGLALLDFQLWLENAMAEGKVTEYDVAMKLMDSRSKRFGYVGPSFFPIVGYLDHGAIVHFRVSPESANPLKNEGILLFDSGGQYKYGTTDITRTIALGDVSPAMKKDFTLVLKGMIRLSQVRFPAGTHGCHLDVLAREALWLHARNYGHGTGHGVGAFMNVHEGPGSIRPDLNNQALKAGNVFSNEPGLYRADQYGIRIENLIYVVEDVSNEFGQFYRFETLTRYPIDTKLIDKALLTSEELIWINEYHQSVLAALSPFTNTEEFQLLKRLTMAI